MMSVARALTKKSCCDGDEAVQQALRAGAAYLFARQKEDFHWCAELGSNPTVTAEYVFMAQALGLDLDSERQALATWLLGQQKLDGSFGMAVNCAGDLSTSCEVYLALKILGLSSEQPALQKIRVFVLAHGGLARCRIFTRIFFALFGLFEWRAVPAMPAELILLPSWCPINIYRLASWARGTVVPLLILAHHRPTYALPGGIQQGFTDELWHDAADKNVPYLPPWKDLWQHHGLSWSLFFSVADVCLKFYEPHHLKGLRRLALRRCTAWILERQEKSGDWAGIFPPMLNNLLALPLQGYHVQSQPMRLGLQAMQRFAIDDEKGRRVQACVSPVWDTILAVICLRDAGVAGTDRRLSEAMRWVEERQITECYGDWSVYRPDLAPGGWSFEYDNRWYPDVDDTAAVLLALLKQDPSKASTQRVRAAVQWILGMQNRDGGWAAFDADNDKLFLNEAPFADMKALCDPSTADVTGRIIEAFGFLCGLDATPAGRYTLLPKDLIERMENACRTGITFLCRTQEPSGAWFGRWGVNYLYGTSHVLCGLAHVPGGAPQALCVPALNWLKRMQNSDGGWGETLQSYADPGLAGKGPSTASQTAWALMALLAHLRSTEPSIEAGVAFLIDRQMMDKDGLGTWVEAETTATGFPGHFYVRYDLYRHYFPMMALGRFAAKRA